MTRFLLTSAADSSALADKDYGPPTPIQVQAIPPVAGRDLCGIAQTGPARPRLCTPIPNVGEEPRSAAIARPPRSRADADARARQPGGTELSHLRAGTVALRRRHLRRRRAALAGGALRRGVDILVATPAGCSTSSINGSHLAGVEDSRRPTGRPMLDLGFIVRCGES